MQRIEKLQFLTCLIFSFLVFSSCNKNQELENIDFREEMRLFVQEISNYAKTEKPNFQIVPQNGASIIYDLNVNQSANMDYLSAIDGIGQEDFLFGYDSDNEASSEDIRTELLDYLNVYRNNGNQVLVTDYCWDSEYVINSYESNYSNDFISYAAPSRELTDIPNTVYHENNDDISSLLEAKNFLYVINADNYPTKEEFIAAIAESNYDVILIDLFYGDEESYTQDEISILKTKANGANRLLLSYMSIGEAENYRWYWDDSWSSPTGRIHRSAPSWLGVANPNWIGNYKVKYWDSEWKSIIYGSTDSYLDRVISTGFDGVYLDIIDAYDYYEDISGQ